MNAKKSQTDGNMKALMGILWEVVIKHALGTLGVAFVILTIALPFLLHKPMAWIMSPFTVATWAHIWMSVDTIRRQRAEERFKYGTVVERLQLVLSVIFSISLIGIVVTYYFVDFVA